MSSNKIIYGILTVSDSCKLEGSEDRSGPVLTNLVKEQNGQVHKYEIVEDDRNKIKSILVGWCDGDDIDVILTTGGTGFTPRDVTPEATKEIIEKCAPGIQAAMTITSLAVTPFAMLSRGIAGILNSTLIVNLPGSPKAVKECFEVIGSVLPHAVDQLHDRQSSVKHIHKKMQATGHQCPLGKDHSMSKESTAPPDMECLNPNQVARRHRKSPYPLISVEEAVAIVMKHALPGGTVSKDIQNSYGFVIAEDIVAREAVPPFPASIKDGYAVIASDGAGPRRVLGGTNAGDVPNLEVFAGSCSRISTGAPLPRGADAVVQVEDTDLLREADDGLRELSIEVLVAPTGPGQDVRQLGSDIEVGELCLPGGTTVLRGSELGVAAAVGCTKLLCYRRPLVGVLSTGDELIEPDAPSSFGKIRDCNRTSLIQSLRCLGYEVFDLGIANDDVVLLRQKLEVGLAKCDVIITSGGVSMGEKDLLKHVLVTDYKAEIHFGRVFMKPGKPTTFATLTYPGAGGLGRRLVFGLPGNPVSALVTCQLYVIPALRRMSGYPQGMSPSTVVKARLSEDVHLDPRPEYHRCLLNWESSNDCNLPLAISTGNQISSRLMSMRSASGLLCLPPASQGLNQLAKGSVVDAILMDRF